MSYNKWKSRRSIRLRNVFPDKTGDKIRALYRHDENLCRCISNNCLIVGRIHSLTVIHQGNLFGIAASLSKLRRLPSKGPYTLGFV